MNYKKMYFNNSMKDFQLWCMEFPPMEVGTHRRFYNRGSYYMSVEKVQIFDACFEGVTVRKWEDGDFEIPRDLPEDVEQYFDRKVEKYIETYLK